MRQFALALFRPIWRDEEEQDDLAPSSQVTPRCEGLSQPRLVEMSLDETIIETRRELQDVHERLSRLRAGRRVAEACVDAGRFAACVAHKAAAPSQGSPRGHKRRGWGPAPDPQAAAPNPPGGSLGRGATPRLERSATVPSLGKPSNTFWSGAASGTLMALGSGLVGAPPAGEHQTPQEAEEARRRLTFATCLMARLQHEALKQEDAEDQQHILALDELSQTSADACLGDQDRDRQAATGPFLPLGVAVDEHLEACGILAFGIHKSRALDSRGTNTCNPPASLQNLKTPKVEDDISNTCGDEPDGPVVRAQFSFPVISERNIDRTARSLLRELSWRSSISSSTQGAEAWQTMRTPRVSGPGSLVKAGPSTELDDTEDAGGELPRRLGTFFHGRGSTTVTPRIAAVSRATSGGTNVGEDLAAPDSPQSTVIAEGVERVSSELLTNAEEEALDAEEIFLEDFLEFLAEQAELIQKSKAQKADGMEQMRRVFLTTCVKRTDSEVLLGPDSVRTTPSTARTPRGFPLGTMSQLEFDAAWLEYEDQQLYTTPRVGLIPRATPRPPSSRRASLGSIEETSWAIGRARLHDDCNGLFLPLSLTAKPRDTVSSLSSRSTHWSSDTSAVSSAGLSGFGTARSSVATGPCRMSHSPLATTSTLRPLFEDAEKQPAVEKNLCIPRVVLDGPVTSPTLDAPRVQAPPTPTGSPSSLGEPSPNSRFEFGNLLHPADVAFTGQLSQTLYPCRGAGGFASLDSHGPWVRHRQEPEAEPQFE